MYTLHHFPYSQHGRRVISLLEEASIPYQLSIVDLMEGKHMQEPFLSINPNHQVPAMSNDDFSLSESNAILRYLCNKHALTNWYPENPEQRATVDQWLDWNQCRLFPTVRDIVLNQVFLGDQGDETAIEKGKETLPELFDILTKGLQKQEFLAGGQPTIADLSVASNIFQLGLAQIFPEGPSLIAWYDKICSLPGFQKSLPSA